VTAIEFELDNLRHGTTFGAFVSGHDRGIDWRRSAGSKSRTGSAARCVERGVNCAAIGARHGRPPDKTGL
jgi:hypothetical protein